MMTGQAPQPEFFDMSDELDRIAREGTRSPICCSHSRLRSDLLYAAGLIYNDGGWLWPTEPSSTSGSDPFSEYSLCGTRSKAILLTLMTSSAGGLW